MSAGILENDRIRLTELAWYGNRFPQAQVIESIGRADVAQVMDFDITPEQVFVLDQDGNPIPVENRFAQVRSSTDGEFVPLSIMSQSNEVVFEHNMDYWRFVKLLKDKGDIHVFTDAGKVLDKIQLFMADSAGTIEPLEVFDDDHGPKQRFNPSSDSNWVVRQARAKKMKVS